MTTYPTGMVSFSTVVEAGVNSTNPCSASALPVTIFSMGGNSSGGEIGGMDPLPASVLLPAWSVTVTDTVYGVSNVNPSTGTSWEVEYESIFTSVGFTPSSIVMVTCVGSSVASLPHHNVPPPVVGADAEYARSREPQRLSPGSARS
ncbi:uncharacterized protein SOCE26_050020 [Sorangium cellulosum]|uniref:Uncharacterized protein n=1 Tax=Sorangium cellulosum TaxID=56 RepID=A0A2L0EW94_SORCE|nr:hypothetical protein [Sorangium cellulosum]AUX43552.1 uncharacterized protein SOCE26_050020 [Sorangium cellulosum]